MTDELRNILERFNPDEPYVWRLRIGDETYQLLEAYIAEKSASMSKDITESDARLVIIYLAEWYRRIYKGSETGQTNAADDIDLKRVWEASGIRSDRYVYQTEAAHGFGNTPSMCWGDLPCATSWEGMTTAS